MQLGVLTRDGCRGEEEAAQRGVLRILFYRGSVDQGGETRGSMEAGDVARSRGRLEASMPLDQGRDAEGEGGRRSGQESGKIGGLCALSTFRPQLGHL